MPAIIFAHPRSEVKLQDPRDPPVTEDSIVRALQASNAERIAVNRQTGTHIPLHVRALRGELPEDTCCACGHPTIDHVGGCAQAIRANKPMQTSYPLGLLYGDPHRAVTEAITLALEDSCGPAVALLFETLGNDERLMVARQLSRAAVSAHLAEMAK